MSVPDQPIPKSEIDDARLAHAARTGDADALALLIARHQGRVYRMCLRVTGDEEAAADATQDALLRVVRAIGGFDERAQFTTWITRIAINACLTRARSEKLRRHTSLDAPARVFGSGISANRSQSDQRPSVGEGFASGEQMPDQRVQQSEEQSRVLKALAGLEVEARAILLLRDGHDLEYDQIAEMLGVAIGTVKSRLFRARQALRELMEKSEGS